MACTAAMVWTQFGASIRTVYVVCTVTNSGSTALNVTSVDPGVSPTGLTSEAVAVAVGVPLLSTTSVAASGTLAIAWQITFHAPTTAVTEAAARTPLSYAPSATITMSDGSIVAASCTTGNFLVTSTAITADS